MNEQKLNEALDFVPLFLLKEAVLLERNMVVDAELNLRYAGLFDKNSDYAGKLGDAVLDLVKKFSEQRHSGFSAEMTNELFNKLIKGHALTKRYWDEKSSGLRRFYREHSMATQFPGTPENENYFLKLCLGKCPNR